MRSVQSDYHWQMLEQLRQARQNQSAPAMTPTRELVEQPAAPVAASCQPELEAPPLESVELVSPAPPALLQASSDKLLPAEQAHYLRSVVQWLVLSTALLVINIRWSPQLQWAHWPFLIWGLPLVYTGLNAFVLRGERPGAFALRQARLLWARLRDRQPQPGFGL